MAGAWQGGWMEGGQAISRRLVGALLLVKPEPRRYCPSCVKNILGALFWLQGPQDSLLQAEPYSDGEAERSAGEKESRQHIRRKVSRVFFHWKLLKYLRSSFRSISFYIGHTHNCFPFISSIFKGLYCINYWVILRMGYIKNILNVTVVRWK